MPALTLAFAFALAAAPTAPTGALPPGTVVAGVSTVDGTHTDVTAFLPDGGARVLFTEAHAPGFVPKGVLDARAGRLALAVQHEGADGASVVVLEIARDHAGALAAGARALAGERAIASQAPRFDGDRVTWVRAAEAPARSQFDIVSAPIGDDAHGAEEVLASIEGAWLAPLRSDAAGRFVHITAGGEHRVVVRAGAALELVRSLGPGPLRLPAFAGARVVVERPRAGRAQLFTIANAANAANAANGREVIVRDGIAGMDPLAVDDVVVAGAGTKRAALVVLTRGEGLAPVERVLDLGRAGVATPLAGAHVHGALVVVARLDRGRALPPEVWIVDARGARAIVIGGAVEVYGVVGAGGGAP